MRISALLLVLVPATALAQPRIPASTAEFTTRGGEVTRERIVNRTFERVAIDGTPVREALLVMEVEANVEPARGPLEGSARVRALGLRAGTFSAPMWTVEAVGERVEVLEGRYLRVTHSPCCATVDTHTLYDVADGRRMFSYTSPLLVFRAERGAPTLVSFESGDAADAPPELGGDGGLGVLRVSRDARILDRLVLRGATLEAGDLASCDAAGRVRNAEWAEPGTTVHACVAMFGGGVAVFPLRDGRFVLEAAVLPPGLTADRVP